VPDLSLSGDVVTSARELADGYMARISTAMHRSSTQLTLAVSWDRTGVICTDPLRLPAVRSRRHQPL